MSGKLFYLMGASGSGKDSLLQGCRSLLHPEDRTLIAHRFITRSAGAGGENHIHLTETEFRMRLKSGLFALHWASHGHLYGISSEINSWLAANHNVIINGSREYLNRASEQYQQLVPVMVNVDENLLRQRLVQRGRENEAEIEKRLTRHHTLLHAMPPQTLFIDNSSSLEDGVQALLRIIKQH
ncbi:phosphonate metabolism protein/1,5-bisphosphokinase (PRPP-forming) PhnN [uncultured Neptuniibacter sp.]|uniref:phosphonate metabolism protein/1,5-bisphosphokinase (PRPP-forming) PhnN n=1 Tax=uncultured Neptuniibacter sp. TaxID=502143 RepID=UPI002616856B|nr:phosphonate metabolism protein/1,5-bisphosphokinase (PRPP-forming) PhnN [uncultured Neptuniibacter sp.]